MIFKSIFSCLLVLFTIIFASLALSLIYSIPALSAEPKIKVLVIDSGLDLADIRFKNVLCKSGHKDFTGGGIRDDNGHGTHIAGLIMDRAKEVEGRYCMVIYKYYDMKATTKVNMENGLSAFNSAYKIKKLKFLNYSSYGYGENYQEYIALRKLIVGKDVVMSVAAGNDGLDIDIPGQIGYPAGYKIPGMHVVGNLLINGIRNVYSNYGNTVTDWIVGTDLMSTLPNGKTGTMTGTSQATASLTGMLVKEYLLKKSHGSSYKHGKNDSF